MQVNKSLLKAHKRPRRGHITCTSTSLMGNNQFQCIPFVTWLLFKVKVSYCLILEKKTSRSSKSGSIATLYSNQNHFLLLTLNLNTSILCAFFSFILRQDFYHRSKKLDRIRINWQLLSISTTPDKELATDSSLTLIT